MKVKFFLIALLLSTWGKLALADKVYTIYPIPQEQIQGKGTVTITKEVNAILESGIDDATKKRLIQVLTEHNINVVFSQKPQKNKTNIYLGINSSKGIADTKLTLLKLQRDVFRKPKFDRHIVSIFEENNQAQILIVGENTDATFFGLASLEQILDTGLSNKPCVTIYDYADIKSRGVIEGYYGVPYTVEVTKDLLRFMMRYKMNSYMYGAKSDPYHSQKWEEPYPTSITPAQEKLGLLSQDMMKSITSVSHDTKVNFIWAIHPGGAFTDANNSNVISKIIHKFQLMHDLGVRQFGVFVDDIGVPNDAPTLKLNADRLTELQNKMDEKWNNSSVAAIDTVKPLHFVPQLYAYSWANQENRKKFFGALSHTPSKVQIYITGAGVWTVPNSHDLEVIKEDLGRDVAWWWNYPCNDNADAQIFASSMYDNFFDMPAIDNNARLPKDLQHCISLLSNPMQQGEISKIPIFSVADFSWNNSSFDNETSWKAATKAVLGEKYGQDFQLLAPYFRWNDPKILESYISEYKTTKDASKLIHKLNEIISASSDLLTIQSSSVKSNQLFYDDIKAWLLKLNKSAIYAKELIEVAHLNNSDVTKWERYQKAVAGIDSLTMSSVYNIEALEGMGKGITVQTYNVKLAQKYLTPFLLYLKDNALSNFWNKSLNPTIISSIKNHKAKMIFYPNLGKGYISLSNGITLKYQDFIGIEFPLSVRLKEFFVKDNIYNDYTIYYSLNGKDWLKFERGKTPESYIKYIKIQNNSSDNKELKLTSTDFYFQYPLPMKIESAQLPDGNIYDGHTADKIKDGNLNTFACLNRNQKKDDAYTVILKTSDNIHDVRIYMGTTNGDYMNQAYIQTSTTGKRWTALRVKDSNISAFTMNLPQVHTLNKDVKYIDYDAKGKKARYIRLLVTEPNENKWLRLYEIAINQSFYENQFQSSIINGDNKSLNILEDNKGTEYAKDLKSPITYHLQSLKPIEALTFYQRPNNVNMSIEVEIEKGQWKSIGTLFNEYQKTFDLSKYPSAISVRISWEGNKMPLLYEIAQTDKSSSITNVTQVKDDDKLNYNIIDHQLYLKNLKDVKFIGISSLDGKRLLTKKVKGKEVVLPFSFEINVIYIFSLQINDSSIKSYKLWIEN